MRQRILWLLLLLLSAWGARAQTTLQQESFETNGEGSRYTSSAVQQGTVSVGLTPTDQYWQRATQPSANGEAGNTFNTRADDTYVRELSPQPGTTGSYFWAGEAVRGSAGRADRQPATLALNAVSVNGYNNMQVKISLAAFIGASGLGTWENTDTLKVQVRYNGAGPWVNVGQVTGDNGPDPGNARLDSNLNGRGNDVADTNSPTLNGTLTDFTFNVPATANTLQVRVLASEQGISEEFGFDNIRVLGTTYTGAAPVLANAETTVRRYATGGAAVPVTSTLTVSDADNTTLSSAAVRFAVIKDADNDVLAFVGDGTTGNITGSYNASTQTLSLTSSGSSATLAQWQAALRRVTFQTTTGFAASGHDRAVVFTVTDPNGLVSNAAYRSVGFSAATAPTVTTGTANPIMSTSATISSNSLTNDGGDGLTSYGVVYVPGIGTPTISNSKVEVGTSSPTSFPASFAASLTGLTPGTTYTVRAYATNPEGTSYGSSITFTTTAQATAKAAMVNLNANGTGTLTFGDVNNGSAGAGNLSYTIQKIVYGRVPEHNALALMTPNGANFTQIRFASYGAPNYDNNGNYSLGSCNDANSVAAAQNAYVGKASGTMYAENFDSRNSPALGDPCSGTQKSLAVQAGYSDNAASLAYDCTEAGKTQYVLLTVTDANGSTSTAVAQVTVNAPPTATIASVNPSAAMRGATVTVTGTNLGGLTSLTVHGTPATISNLTATGFTFVVPAGASVGTGTIEVMAPCSQTVSSSFEVLPVAVSSIIQLTPTPTATLQATYRITFSGSLTGLQASNFSFTDVTNLSAPSVASVTGVNGSTSQYDVVVNTGTLVGNNSGTLRLVLANGTGTSPGIALPAPTAPLYTIIRNFNAGPQLVVQGIGSPTSRTDVTAFVDVVQVLRGGSNFPNGLLNNSFESSNVPSSGYYYSYANNGKPAVSADAWSFSSNAGIARSGSGFGPTVPDGDAVAFVQTVQNAQGGIVAGSGSVAQTVGVPTGNNYQVSFRAGQRSATNDQVLNVFLYNGTDRVFIGSIQPANSTYETFTSATFAVTAPELTATVSTTSPSPTSTAPIPFRVNFTNGSTAQSVGTSFTASDVTVTNGTVTTGSFSGSGSGPYTFTVTPSGAGTVTVSLAADVASDANNTGNSQSNSVSVQYQLPVTVAPVLTAPATGTNTSTTPTYTGTAPAGSTVTVYVDGSAIGSTTATGGTFSLAQPTALALGNHTAYATAQSSGSTVSANSNANTFTVGPTTNNALAFDASDDYVAVAAQAGVSNLAASGYTLEAWVYLNSVTGGVNSVIRKDGDYNLYIRNGVMTLQVWQGNTFKYNEATTTLIPGRWNHVAGTWDGNSLRLYINGVDATGTTNALNLAVNSPLQLGRSATFNEPLNGRLDEVRIYNAPLTAAQVAADMFSTTAAVPASLQLYYNFDEGVPGGNNAGVTALLDQSGKGNTGTLTNFALTGTASNWIRSFPTITAINPTSGLTGSSVSITGTNLLDATSFAFNGTAVTPFTTPTNDLSATVTVPAGATTGPVSVASPILLKYNGPVFTVTSPASVAWTGNQDTNWFIAANWSPQQVPNATIDAIIPTAPSGNRFPVIGATNGLEAAARNVSIATGASLSMNNNTLTIAADLTNNGDFNGYVGSGSAAAGGTVVLGSVAQSNGPNILGSGSTRFWNLTVNSNGVLLGTSAGASVKRLLTLNGAFVTQGNPFTLLSDADGTALVVNNGTAGFVLGQATVRRYIDPTANSGPGYRHFSPAVGLAQVQNLATSGFTPMVNPAYNTSPTPSTLSNFPTVYGYNQGRLATANNNLSAFDKGWYSPSSGEDDLTVGKGYTVNIAGDQTFTLTGPLNNGLQSQTLARADASSPNATAAGWHLVGNPYPAPLDYSLVDATDRTGLTGSMYVYTSTSQYKGQYRTYLAPTGSNPGIGNPILPQGQGFFVRVATAGTSATLNLRNSQRVTSYQNPAYQRTSAETRPLVQLSLRPTTGSSLTDDFYVYFDSHATDGYDPQYDADKLANPVGLNLSSSLSATQRLAIDGRAALGSTERVVPLAVGVPAVGSYTFSTRQLLNLSAVPTYLRDLQTGAVIDLARQPDYQFTVSNASALITGRFELVFSPQKALATAPAALTQQVSLYPNPAKNLAYLELPAALGSQPVTATLVDALGREVRQLTLPAQGATAHVLDLHELATGVYALRLTTSAGTLVRKLTVE